jgi:hypothetical protein
MIFCLYVFQQVSARGFYLENERFGIPVLQMAYGSPLKFAPKGQGPHFVAINPGACKKTYGLVHQPTFCSTPYFVGMYFLPFFFISTILNMSLACMIGPCAQKRGSFCKNLFLCHVPAFFSLGPQWSLKGNPSFCKEMGSLICAALFFLFTKADKE